MKQIIVDNISTTYYITEEGKCFNSITKKYLKGQINYKNGYRTFYITLPDGERKRLYAHRVVAEAFIPNPNHKPCVNHLDCNRDNNCVENLEWVTHSENSQYAYDCGSRATKPIYCFSKDQQLVAKYKSQKEATKATGISYSQLSSALRQEEKTMAHGFYWSYEPFLKKVVQLKNTGKAKKVNQYTLQGKYITSYSSCGIAARATRGHQGHIAECCRGRLKTSGGFIWRYADDIVLSLDEN